MKKSSRIPTPTKRAGCYGVEVVVAKSEDVEGMMAAMSAAGKGFVQVGDDVAPGECAEERMPLLGRDKLHPIPCLPDHDDSPGKVGTGCADL